MTRRQRAWPLRALVLFLLHLVAACGASAESPVDATREAIGPPVEEIGVPVEDVGATIASAWPLGRWQGDEVCLELFANHDFELTLRGKADGPRHLVMGSASTPTTTDGQVALGLSVSRIWRSRYLSRCRKVNQAGADVDTANVLGVDLSLGAVTVLTLRKAGDDQVELCGTQCAVLVRDAPELHGRWRRSDLAGTDWRKLPFAGGELLEINVGTTSPTLLVAAGDEEFDFLLGEATIVFRGDDRFDVTFASHDETRPRRYGVRRLAGQRVEVCEPDGRCAIFDRQFE